MFLRLIFYINNEMLINRKSILGSKYWSSNFLWMSHSSDCQIVFHFIWNLCNHFPNWKKMLPQVGGFLKHGWKIGNNSLPSMLTCSLYLHEANNCEAWKSSGSESKVEKLPQAGNIKLDKVFELPNSQEFFGGF